MARLPSPVIVIPGITATYLRDEYPLPPDMVWTVMTNDFPRVTPHPDNPKFEASEPSRVAPGQIYEVAYAELIKELRYNLSDSSDRPVPVYPFGYDWRQPLDMIEDSLAAFVDEVIERTKLMRHYADDDWADDPRVNLIGHSMGGLIAAGYVQKAAAKARVDRVVSLASPFRGSFEAVLKITTGTAAIGGAEPASREREAARLTPALYHLLPSFPGSVTADVNAQLSWFNPDVWQPSVKGTLANFIKTYGLPEAGRAARRSPAERAESLLASFLKRAKDHRDRIESPDLLKKAGLTSDNWLCVVGVDSKTRVSLEVKSPDNKPRFDLASEGRANKWEDGATDAERELTGDGTVPFRGACPGFLSRNQLVCVSPSDFGYWEVQDRVTSSVAGFHGILPNMDMLHRMIVRFFTGRPDKNKNTWGWAPPGLKPNEKWAPPLALTQKTE
jgi:pimeloyl-ACP methyl ester carboxylesterase